MDMSVPAGNNPIDDNRQGLIGKPLDRVDGHLKVTGQATYAYEYAEAGVPLYGFVVTATIAKGRIRTIDTRTAERLAGVRLVLTWRDMPPQGRKESGAAPQLVDEQVLHFGQPVALVVAESFEVARAGAALVSVDYEAAPGVYDLAAAKDTARTPKPGLQAPDSALGDFGQAFASAPVQVDEIWSTPHQSHAMMEPHATLAVWHGDQLTLYTSNQMLTQAQATIAHTFQIEVTQVRVVSRYIGGGFGAKLQVHADAILAAAAARKLQRPVKLALTRQQVFHVTTHRSATIQRVRLGADQQGRLQAIAHESWSGNTEGENGYESAATQTRSLYAAPNRQTAHRLATLDLPVASAMRAPGEAVGLLALECAMDELAEKLKLDPIELRRRNEPTVDPERHVPYSVRQLVGCMDEGARRFGWDRRNPVPAQVRDGRWLVGLGMAAAIRSNFLRPSQATARVDSDGMVTIKMAMTDIGTGSYTVFTQVAAEMLGVPPARVKMLLGDTEFPAAAGSGGSFGAASGGSAAFEACDALRQKLALLAGFDPATALFANGMVSNGQQSRSLASLAGAQGVEAAGAIGPGDLARKFSQQAYGAHFVEVGVDRDTGEIRVRRMLSVFAAGRILNQKTARSQALGGMTFGIGAALMEDTAPDPHCGVFSNHDLAQYHVPAHADVPELEVVFLPETDDKANPLKIKGIGELGICGAGAAVANAIYNACGVRVRDYPVTLDKLLPYLPAQA
ncbi:xanthine dehydrogenase YagR molybdenum-binding subunit [Silvimonas terrae]|uniref:Xanthine dehydrogenase YagR molybdenum-binding subunit n=1 Tax=Silvimonas terrae TaxID=300266 RepID=A0A840RE29_9NEIS|nr:xanthine dehydrogenase family protein molybdopterin-binding subunit [Silvimonas terrae]MBB5190613.1 xanthine dehydrogenase YagR molybdenum-binding subunit [Silvimonas terrae]